MTDSGPWTNNDFDQMSWHDVHVHGFRLEAFKEELGSCELVLDIDYILAWETVGDAFRFTVCQAALRFHDVFGLKVALDYAAPTAGMCAFSLAGIQREELACPRGYNTYRWRLDVNWPQGFLEFDAPGFTQTLVGVPHVQVGQSLPPELRNGGVAA